MTGGKYDSMIGKGRNFRTACYDGVQKGNEEEMEATMEQMKILNLDFGKEWSHRKTLVEERSEW